MTLQERNNRSKTEATTTTTTTTTKSLSPLTMEIDSTDDVPNSSIAEPSVNGRSQNKRRNNMKQ